MKNEDHETALADLRRKFREQKQGMNSLQHATESEFQTIRQALARELNQKQEQIYHTLEESSESLSRKFIELENNLSQIQSYLQEHHTEQRTQALEIKEATVHTPPADNSTVTSPWRTSPTVRTTRNSSTRNPTTEYGFQVIQ